MVKNSKKIIGLVLTALLVSVVLGLGAVFPIPLNITSATASVPLLVHSGKLMDRYELLISELIAQNPAQSKPILILQHIASPSPLHLGSIATHRAYAAVHGYEYRSDNNSYVVRPQNKEEKSMNKMYTLRNAMQDELESGKAEWIFSTDADTFIYDPPVPLHLLLPPSSVSPTPYTLGNQDGLGFNAGAMLFRVNRPVFNWLNSVIAVYEAMKDRKHGHVADQLLLQQALIDNPEFASRFYEIPKGWMNAYGAGESWEGVQLQIHLVSRLKWTQSWIAILEKTVFNAERYLRVGEGEEEEQSLRLDTSKVEAVTEAAATK